MAPSMDAPRIVVNECPAPRHGKNIVMKSEILGYVKAQMIAQAQAPGKISRTVFVAKCSPQINQPVMNSRIGPRHGPS